MVVRKALLNEANELSHIALASKATWDYSEEFILACKEDLTITEEYIKNHYVYILENEGVKIGFFHFNEKKKMFSIFYIYIQIIRERVMVTFYGKVS
ncbi:acetyltransferase, GNAT family [Bacillus pseudomycoides]|nr:acetyltransferase, GNAT family [Bacillus pseudomycoides]